MEIRPKNPLTLQEHIPVDKLLGIQTFTGKMASKTGPANDEASGKLARQQPVGPIVIRMGVYDGFSSVQSFIPVIQGPQPQIVKHGVVRIGQVFVFEPLIPASLVHPAPVVLDQAIIFLIHQPGQP